MLQTAMMLLIQIMLPMALLTAWRVNMAGILKLIELAVWYWKSVNRRLETVLDPDMKEPSMPIKGANRG